MRETIRVIEAEVQKVIAGKEPILRRVLTVMLAGGHILLEDIPGVGKTTLALAFGKAMDLTCSRVQFTPDVVPSDITGFSMYDAKSGEFTYRPGAALCNLLIADEINRTSSKTQSALLEVMQEGAVTVDGVTHPVPQPFTVIATQNPIGTAGTQNLPEAQLDRFMVQLSMGYPSTEAQIRLLKERRKDDPLQQVRKAVDTEGFCRMQAEVRDVFVDDKIYAYITALTEASRAAETLRLGLSPRGALAMAALAQAEAYYSDRDYVVPDDVRTVFCDVARHRVLLSSKGQTAGCSRDELLHEILEAVPLPQIDGSRQ